MICIGIRKLKPLLIAPSDIDFSAAGKLLYTRIPHKREQYQIPTERSTSKKSPKSIKFSTWRTS